jgi:hypothetical protein
MAFSAGFSPHPKISYLGAAPTGAASEAEYVEIGLTEAVEPGAVASALDAALPDGLDVLAAAPATGAALADRIDASRWSIELPGVAPSALQAAIAALLASESVVVERVTPSGRRQIDVRAALVAAQVADGAAVTSDVSGGHGGDQGDDHDDDRSGDVGAPADVCAILTTVVRQTTPAVRPDDVLGALDVVADLRPPVPAKATRTAQGLLDDGGALADPLGPDRVTTRT